MKKLVFIQSFSKNQNAAKRFEEFEAQGIEVEAYGFNRNESVEEENGAKVHTIGHFTNAVPYHQRIPIIYKGIKRVLNIYKNQEVVYYLFGLDVASIFRLQSRASYIYEEEDLIYTYIGEDIVKKILKRIDRSTIMNAKKAVLTSEGFAQYHFQNNWPENIHIIPNKLKKEVKDYPPHLKDTSDRNLRVGFVGSFRFKSVFNFAKVFLENFPQYSFHFFGSASDDNNRQQFDELKKYNNCFFHGRFKNPEDLPAVYENIDLLLSTYDVEYENVKYAEPNKLYEAIYYETPIIASSGCFLGDKIEKMGIGFSLNALNDEEVISFIRNLDNTIILEKIKVIRSMDKMTAIDNNSEFINEVRKVLNK